MSSDLSFIFNFISESFLHIWPYLLITIPLAVAVNMSGAAKYINRAFRAQPLAAIFLATAVGAFSPFCSCGVIPVVAALLIGGVPLAPVMAFWIASPSMDPEIFFLSVGMLGWELALWRVIATLALSLTAGFITHALMQRHWLGRRILRSQHVPLTQKRWELVKSGWQNVKSTLTPVFLRLQAAAAGISNQPVLIQEAALSATSPQSETGCDEACTINDQAGGCESDGGQPATTSCSIRPVTFKQRLFDETWSATTMVAKFMLLAFFLEALIIRYIPSDWIVGLLGQHNPFAIVSAVLIGVPVYTTNLTALPMISGLLAQGMSPAAALAFLVAGPTTTLPAMAAVWGLATRRVFVAYVAFSLLGAIVFGYLYSLLTIM